MAIPLPLSPECCVQPFLVTFPVHKGLQPYPCYNSDRGSEYGTGKSQERGPSIPTQPWALLDLGDMAAEAS